jgi:hypothetical protein
VEKNPFNVLVVEKTRAIDELVEHPCREKIG